MASKLLKRAVAREATVQALAFDKSPTARKARIAKVSASQWRNRDQRGEFTLGTKRTGPVKPYVETKPAKQGERKRVHAD
ncbi:hypothetical protein VAC51_00010 [Variovorax phage VAC_51]|uniref:Uncharacterized protein n=1 Tax=Variovorax phage VAC_51 TaxID=2985242 RepID=A0A9N6ZG57_9CAUD|nr:hypothetical protein VAC51_00010 [Variovorax phage VAC_51]